MADALGSSLSASLAIAAHYLAPSQTAPSPTSNPIPPINLDAPAYVNPSVSFNPATNVVFLTYRNADTGKVTEQYPPSQVLSRYQFVDETGMPSPTPPGSTPDQLAGMTRGLVGGAQPPSTSGTPPSTKPGTLA